MDKFHKIQKIKKISRMTALYIIIAGISFIIILPIYFLTVLSFLSDYEAYNQWPTPCFPALSFDFKISQTLNNYTVKIFDKTENNYVILIESDSFEKIATFIRRKTNCRVEPGILQEMVSGLQQKHEKKFSLNKEWLANYKTFFKVTEGAAPAIFRSLYAAFLTILISVSIGGLAGYSFARYGFRGRNTLKLSVLFVRMFPGISIAIPMVIILGNIGLYDNPVGLSMVYSVGQIGLSIWITASIFMGIPVELEEAAQVFGASKFQTFFMITLPLALPGLAACAMYAFIASWNETLQAIVLTQFNPTFPVLVYQTLVGSTAMVNLAAAGGIIMALPAVVFTLIIRKYILKMWGGVSV